MSKENFIFGLRPVLEAILAGKEVDKILLQKGLRGELFRELRETLKDRPIPIQFVPEEKLRRITGKNHQGVIALLSPIIYQNPEDILMGVYEDGRIPFFVVLDGITDVRNMGAIARTCESAGADAIIVPARGSAQINEDAVKTSAGALMRIPVCRSENLLSTVNYLKASGLRIISGSEKSNVNYTKPDYRLPLAIVMGAEDKGVSPGILGLSDESVSIPQLGDIASLNVSVAAGIILYEVVRQRHEKTG